MSADSVIATSNHFSIQQTIILSMIFYFWIRRRCSGDKKATTELETTDEVDDDDDEEHLVSSSYEAYPLKSDYDEDYSSAVSSTSDFKSLGRIQ